MAETSFRGTTVRSGKRGPLRLPDRWFRVTSFESFVEAAASVKGPTILAPLLFSS